ncbi:hypothetical protein B0T26DRAFT_753084 [Lasiosphaeria miniovina]|uniref:Apple domain-containing protein n=1 Tax=Lasiosphaeria miniovina TaxID=1954250 RepID=A0AA40ABP2_9PEZI|nr:uncharacterized protein B0T26DRAFT_753084 [Lasiosphaeria miniovina]KAK0712906.1 hypothetical protein B0T26DRAFT_753084 [Lasiosphaeria miniovina]
MAGKPLYPQAHQQGGQQGGYSDGLIPTENSYPEVVTYQTEPKPAGQQIHSLAPSSPPGWSRHHQVNVPPYQSQFAPSEPMTDPPGNYRPWWKRKITWFAIVGVLVIAVLAGILGAVASGSIKTSGNSSGGCQSAGNWNRSDDGVPPEHDVEFGDGSSDGEYGDFLDRDGNEQHEGGDNESDLGDVTLECPGAEGLNFTTSTAVRGTLTFARYCDVNYAFGDQTAPFGKTNETIFNMPDCIKACANLDGCVAVAFNPGPQCWLKQFLGSKSSSKGTEMAILFQ